MSSARSRLRTTSARSADRTGASVKPQLPITAVVTPCQHELVPARVPEHLGVHVGVAVDEAGRHHVALGVDLAPAPLPDPADEGDAVADHADVGAERAQSRPVDDRPVRITRSYVPCQHIPVIAWPAM